MGTRHSNHMEEMAPLLGIEEIENTQVYPVIHMIRQDVILYVDNPLSYEALLSPELTYRLVKPLEDKYIRLQREGNLSVVFCYLINRVHFLRDGSFSTVALSRSRAALCEILAIRAMRIHADDMLELTTVLTTSWPLFAGARSEVLKRADEEENMDPDESAGNAIEMAILGKAKRFIKSSPCQKVIDAIWSGKCVYQADSSHSILSDTYKRTPVHLYNPHTAPLLDHYRLKVPAIRSVLEYINFVILFVLFVVALEFSAVNHINLTEGLFMIFALGFSLEKIASMQEHGLRVYVTGTWNGFDVLFISVYGAYLVLRVWGIINSAQWALVAGMDCLALAACLIFPRLAFVTLSNNLMILSLRSMFMEFAVLMAIATFCFAGFLYALWTLSRSGPKYSADEIAWWMLDLFFGLDSSGFNQAATFHPVYGPILMISYACLSNTLLLTVLVSMLSYTFSSISSDAAAEAMYRRAVSTIEGVKADVLFSYQPPLNLVALVIMFPASYILSPRWFHKVNVFMIRVTSFPILLCISFYERQKSEAGLITFYEYLSSSLERALDSLPKGMRKLANIGFSRSGAEIDAVFDIEDEIAFEQSEHALESHTSSSQIDNGQATFTTSASPRLHPLRHFSTPVSRRPSVNRSTLDAEQSLRPRAVSHRATGLLDTISPLAQAYNNVNVHPVEENLTEDEGALSNSPQQSASPIALRRLHQRKTSSSLHLFPPFAKTSPLASSHSPPKTHHGPKKVTQLESESEMIMGGTESHISLEVERRLARVEESQLRIEALLANLVSKRVG